MKIHGVGIDVVEIRRVAAALERRHGGFARRVFTAAEAEHCEGRHDRAASYAVRFAAKEAVAKALGTGVGSRAAWLDMEIVRQPTEAPQVVLHGAARRFADEHHIIDIKISLTHSREYAVANAIALAAETPI